MAKLDGNRSKRGYESIRLWPLVSTVNWCYVPQQHGLRPSGPFLVLVMFSLCRTLDMMQNDTVTSGNDMFFVLFGLCM